MCLNATENHILDNEEWRYDVVPEFFDGKNVQDFVDPDIDAKLQALEKEEEELLQKELEQQDEIQVRINALAGFVAPSGQGGKC